MGTSQITVAKVRQSYGSLVPQDPSMPGVDQFLAALNEVSQRYTEEGKWLGAMARLVVQPQVNLLGTLSNGSDGYIALPRRFASVLGTTFQGCPVPTFSEWHSFVDCGPGLLNPAAPSLGILIDDNDGWPSQRVIPAGVAGTMRVGITNPSDAGKLVRFTGLDGQATRIYDAIGDGFNIPTAYPFSAPSAQVVSVLQGLQGPITTDNTFFKGNWGIWFVPSDTSIPAIQIGQYEPTEQYPCYHRYLCGNINLPTEGPIAVSILAQRRWVQLVAETDFVEPNNLTAMGYGLRAFGIDEAINPGAAAAQWNAGYSRLNAAARSLRGAARIDAEIANGNGNGGLGFGWGAANGAYGSYGFGGIYGGPGLPSAV